MEKSFTAKYGSWALIAGASEGLGAAFAEAAAMRGLNLVLIARSTDKLIALSEVLKEKYSVNIMCFTLDLANQIETKGILDSLNVPIGLLIYNAAYAPIGYFEDIPEEKLAKIIDINIKAPLLLAKWVSKQMIDRQKGGIVFMSSLAGTQGSPKIATYAASKAFNTVLAEGLWKELKRHRIDVIASCAGAILTPGYTQAQQSKAPGTLEAYQVAEKTLHALGKVPVTVPGIFNQVARFLMGRVLPRKTAIQIMNSNTKSLS